AGDDVGAVGDDEVAAGGEPGEQPPDDRAGLVVVGDVAEDVQQHQPDGLVEVERPAGLGEDPLGFAYVGVDVAGGALRAAGQQRAGVGEDERVVVDVDDAGVGRGALRHLVGVVDGRQAGADVEELPDADLAGQVPDRAGEEGPGVPRHVHDLRVDGDELVAGGAVDGVVLLAAQPVVPD